MNVSEISVGDYLNIYNFPNDNPQAEDLFPARVNAVSVFDPFKDPDDVVVELVLPKTNGIASRPLNTCLPVPLTMDIIKANGFKVYSRKLDGEGKHCDIAFLSAFVDSNGIYLSEFNKIEYVHQLQHLMRLLGRDFVYNDN